MTLSQEFDNLTDQLEQLIGLLRESGDRFWVLYLERALKQVRERRLSGATLVLSCYTTEGSLANLEIGEGLLETDPLSHKNLNARLTHLRTSVFKSADRIASRQLW